MLLTNCNVIKVGWNKFIMSLKNKNQKVFKHFKILTKCSNFAAENEHNVKQRFDLGDNQ